MAKKKKAKKKLHRSHSSVGAPKPVQPLATQTAASAQPVSGSAQSTSVARKAVTAGVEAARWTYVGGDVRRIGILAGGCIVAELALWYLFSHTGLGAAAYGLVT